MLSDVIPFKGDWDFAGARGWEELRRLNEEFVEIERGIERHLRELEDKKVLNSVP